MNNDKMNFTETIKRMEELVTIINEANEAYYGANKEIMSNKEYDALYDELVYLEGKTGMISNDSPTLRVNNYTLNTLFTKVEHNRPMLSLNKTKDVNEFLKLADRHVCLLMPKLDGLTIVASYKNGVLRQLATRGDGHVGEDVTQNATLFRNLPLTIPYREEVIVRGEAVMHYATFDELNKNGEYKNPRNLASGLIRSKTPLLLKTLRFIAYDVFEKNSFYMDTLDKMLNRLDTYRFETVPRMIIKSSDKEALESFENKAHSYGIPLDGMVLRINSLVKAENMGTTSKFPKHSIALKWADNTEETILKDVIWSPSRTGVLTPVAVFEPVELEGTTVEKASLHNLSIFELLNLGKGDIVTVYKANMIIPQVDENKTQSGTLTYPKECPICKGDTSVSNNDGVKVLKCENANCPAKVLHRFVHFCSKEGFSIDGLSEKTLEKLLIKGLLTNYQDIFNLNKHFDDIATMDGFGKKSALNLVESIEDAKNIPPANFVVAFGIPLLGVAQSKKAFKSASKNALKQLPLLSVEQIKHEYKFGDVLAHNVKDFFTEENTATWLSLLEIIFFPESSKVDNKELHLFGKSFVITGKLQSVSRRDLSDIIEENGGTVGSSVSKNTSYLINNDIQSKSSKNKRAKELGVPIISEEEALVIIKEQN